MRGRLGVLLFAAALAAACGGGDESAPPPPAEEPQTSELSPSEHLVRVAMALKGTRPSIAELRAVEKDPAAIEGIVDQYLASREFGETVRDLYNDALLS